MDERHRDSYSEVLGEWRTISEFWLRSPYSREPWTFVVLSEISEYEQAHDARVRPDGKLLLALNFDMMIGKPLARAHTRPADADVAQIIREDVRTLLDAAREAEGAGPHGREREDEISAHHLVNALSKNWSRLKSAAQNLWD